MFLPYDLNQPIADQPVEVYYYQWHPSIKLWIWHGPEQGE
jgi:hypothetical protein